MNDAVRYVLQRIEDGEFWDEHPGFWTWMLARELVRLLGWGGSRLDDEARRLVARRCPYRWPA